MTNPPPVKFENLIQNRTLKIIYQKFAKKRFTLSEVVTQFYWLGSIERHIQYMEKQGWIVLEGERFRFIVPVEQWVCENEVC